MKVLILTEGGKKKGFGHITRCIALFEAFRRRGISTKLLVNGDSHVRDILEHKNFQMFDWINNRKRLFQNITKSDFIIVDSYLAKESLYKKLSKMSNGKILMIDDYNRIDYPKGIVLNPSIYGERLSYSKKNDVVYLLGKSYIILREEFWSIPRKKINKEIKNVLITFGGMNNYGLERKIVNYLKNKFNFKFIMVNKKKNKLAAKQILDLMLKSDVCISGGGQTIHELIRTRIPIIGICFAENQLRNLISWEKIGLLKNAGWFNDKKLFQKIEKKFKELDFISRLKMYKTGDKYIDGLGAERIVKEVLKRILEYKIVN